MRDTAELCRLHRPKLQQIYQVNDIRIRSGSRAGSLGGAQNVLGGGVVAEIFRDLSQANRLGGGGGVTEIFRGPSKEGGEGGGGCTTHFRMFTTHSLISRDIHESISQFNKNTNKNLHTQKFKKK